MYKDPTAVGNAYKGAELYTESDEEKNPTSPKTTKSKKKSTSRSPSNKHAATSSTYLNMAMNDIVQSQKALDIIK